MMDIQASGQRTNDEASELEPQSPPAGDQALEKEGAAGPPPPLLIVDRAPDVPALISVDTTSMSVQWSPASITVQSKEIRVVEYLVAYALEMQQVEVDADNGAPNFREDRWSIQYSGAATYVQVKGLRPGRNYAVRVICKPVVTDPVVMVQLAPESDILVVRTPATPPSAPEPPVLAIRQRNSLKFKWSEPSETGGHPILMYVFDCHPAPEGHKGEPTSEGMYEMYRGLERNVVLKRLLPGVRYFVRVKVSLPFFAYLSSILPRCLCRSPYFSYSITFSVNSNLQGNKLYWGEPMERPLSTQHATFCSLRT